MAEGEERFAEPPGGPAEDAQVDDPAAGGGSLPPAVAELLNIAGVQGVALGRNAVGEDAVVVYVLDETTRTRLPERVDGLAVMVVVTGVIEAQD